MGVCPQFDVLWGELTAREHLLLFADVRGLPVGRCAALAEEALEQARRCSPRGAHVQDMRRVDGQIGVWILWDLQCVFMVFRCV